MVVVVGVEEAGCVLSRHLAREQLRFRAGRQFAYVSLLSDMREENELTNPTALILLFFRTTHCCYRHLNPKQLSLRVTDMSRRPPLPREGRGSPLGGAAGGRSGAAGPRGDPASPEGGPSNFGAGSYEAVTADWGAPFGGDEGGIPDWTALLEKDGATDWGALWEQRVLNTAQLSAEWAVLGLVVYMKYEAKESFRNSAGNRWLERWIQRRYPNASSFVDRPLVLDRYEKEAYRQTTEALQEKWRFSEVSSRERDESRASLQLQAGELNQSAKKRGAPSRPYAMMLGSHILQCAGEKLKPPQRAKSSKRSEVSGTPPLVPRK